MEGKMLQQPLTGAPFSITMPQSFYTVQGVTLPGGVLGALQVSERLLDNGAFHTLPEWAEYRDKTGLGPGSGPLVMAGLSALFDNQDCEGVQELRELFAEDFRRGMIAATGITYRSEAPDIVIHDFGTPEQHTLEVQLAGPSSPVNDGMSGVIQALLGNGDIGKVQDVFYWVTGRDSYLSRLDKRPKDDAGLALMLGPYFNSFCIGAGYMYGRPARGMRVVPLNSTGSKG